MTPTTNKSTFLSATNKPTPPVLGKPPRFKLNTLYEKPDVTESILIYGPPGSGKTYTVVEMLRLGERVLLLSTDMGGSGAATITNATKNEPELQKNVLEVTLTNYDDIAAFLKEIPSEVWDFDPTTIVWDGFSNFQTNLVANKVGELTDHKKDTSEAREEGAAFDQQDWGIVRRFSTDTSNNFFALRNPKTQQFPVRVMICWQDFTQKSVNGVSTVTALNCPMLVGHTRKSLGGAFSLVVRTKITRDEKTGDKITYITSGHDPMFQKNRGMDGIKPEEESFQTIWKEVIRNRKQPKS